MKQHGFTLVELIMVIVITGVIAASVTIFLKPVIDSYFDTRRRADLTDIADTALRRMAKDIRSAVPNSMRSVSATCFQLVPTIAGGRYRMASDTVNDSPAPLPCTPSPDGTGTCSAPLDISWVDISQPTMVFDVLSPLSTVPAKDDWVVINNQNAGDVYAGNNRAQISAIPVTPTRNTDGLHRMVVASTQFPLGYDGGRFVVVPNAEQTIFYSCVGPTLYRTAAAFNANQATTCAASVGAIVATDVAACTFVYDPNQGTTQQSGFVWMGLELRRSGENVTLTHGVHVDNVP